MPQAQLLEVHRNTEELRAAGRIERTVVAVNRSDYMLDEPSNTLLQVSLWHRRSQALMPIQDLGILEDLSQWVGDGSTTCAS